MTLLLSRGDVNQDGYESFRKVNLNLYQRRGLRIE